MATNREKKQRILMLDMRAQEAMSDLTTKQKQMVLAYVGGDNLAEAGRKAGYSTGRVYQAAKAPAVASAIHMLDRLHQLEHGVDVGRKREILLDVAKKAAEPGDTYSPGSAVRAVNELNLMDGSHAPTKSISANVSVSVAIDYDVGLPDRGVIEHE